MTFFDQFKQLLSVATTDTQVVARNTLLQDTTYAAQVAASISQLSSDFNIKLMSENVITGGASGLLKNDELAREIQLDIDGADKLVLGFLESTLSNPTKIWVRTAAAGATPADGRRYIITDPTVGVVFANEQGQLVGSLPGLVAGVPGAGEYSTPQSAISLTVGATELIAVAMPTHSLVKLFDATTFAEVAIIGTVATPGLPDAGNLLNTPQDLAFDATNDVLYIVSDTGTATGATGLGYVSSHDLSVPATPAFLAFAILNDGNSLLMGGVSAPTSISFDPTLSALWVVNDGGTPIEIGAVAVSAVGVGGAIVGYLEVTGVGFDITSISRIHLKDATRQMYVGAQNGIELFDVGTMRWQRSFGSLATEDTASSAQPPNFLLTFASTSSVAADTVTIDGTSVDIILTADNTQRRVMRISENLFLGDNLVTFEEMTFTTGISLHGYAVKGTLPSSQVEIQFRVVSGGTWRTLEQTDTVEPSLFYQFRAKVVLTPTDIVRAHVLKQVTIIGEQE
jgi:hypothetical protein